MVRIAGVVVFVVALASVAHAEGKEESRAAAKALFLKATRHYNLGEFREALVDYKEGYRNVPDPVFLFNVGQCQRMLGEFENAIFSYRAYLRSLPDAENRAQVDQRIAEMEEAQRRSIRQGPPDIVSPPAPVGSAAGAPTGAKTAGGKSAGGKSAGGKTAGEKTAGEKTAGEKTAGTKSAGTKSAGTKTAGAMGHDGTAALVETPGAAASSSGDRPVYKRWWPWTVGAVVLVGAGLGIGLGMGLSGGDKIASSGLGNVDLR